MDLPLHVAQNVLEPLTELSPGATHSELAIATSTTTSNTGHNKRQTARGDASYPRKRANTACQVCRARKTKCDNRKPRCSFCERVGARCVSSSSTDLSTFDPASLAILERIDQLEGKLQARNQSAAVDHRDDARSSTHSTPGRLDSTFQTKSTSKGNVAIINVEKILSWPIFHHRFDAHLKLKPLLEGSLSAPDRLSLQSVDRTTAAGELEIESCSGLLDVFFNHVHIKNPVLDEKLTRQWVRDVCLNGISWSAQSCLVLLVCALGAVSLPFGAFRQDDPISAGRSMESVRAEAWFNASQRRIGALLTKGDVLSAQCFFFSGVYLMHTMRPFQAWALFVQALACCQKFDFYAGSFGAPEVQEVFGSETPWRSEESMYWTCFKSELELRLQLSVPGFGAAGDLSYPSFLPSPPPGSVKDQERSWYFYLAEIALRRLRNQILTHVVQYAVDDRFDNLEEFSAWMSSFESHAQEWSRLLPPEMDLQTSQHDDDILRFVLRGHLLDCYETMYWPFLVEAINTASWDGTYQVFVQRGLRVCVERIWKNEGGFYHHHHGAWLMLRSCTRSALTLVAARLCRHLDDLLPTDWEAAVRKVITLLSFWQEESGDARDRRYILETLMANF